MAIDLLKSSTGLTGLLAPASELHLQEISDISINAEKVNAQDSIETLFAKDNMYSNIVRSLLPNVKDSELFKGNGLNQKLSEIYEDLKDLRDPKLRKFVTEVLEPLQADQLILQNYLLNGLKV